MKPAMMLQVTLAIISTFGLLGLAVLPVLHALSPHAPPREEVPGTRSLSFDRGAIRYQISGEQPETSEALLFLHGFNSQLSVWSPVWPHLSSCGRAIRVDIPGFGGSVWPVDSFDLATQADRVMAFLDELKIRKVTLVGISMGASLSVWIASRFPDRVKGMLIIAPSGYPGSLQSYNLFGRILHAGALNRLTAKVASHSLYRKLYPESTALQALTVTASYGLEWLDALQRVRAPTIVMWSRGDQAVPFSYAEAVTRALSRGVLVPLAAEVGHDVLAHRSEVVGSMACRLHQGTTPEIILSEKVPSLKQRGDG